MNHPVTSVVSAPWVRAATSLWRTTVLECEIGRFEYQIFLAFDRETGAKVHPMVGIRINHRPWGDSSEDGKWFNVRLQTTVLEGPTGAFLCDEEGNRVSLICGDPEVFQDFASMFFIERDWTVTVEGQRGSVTSFPLPRDDSFALQFTRLLEDVKSDAAD